MYTHKDAVAVLETLVELVDEGASAKDIKQYVNAAARTIVEAAGAGISEEGRTMWIETTDRAGEPWRVRPDGAQVHGSAVIREGAWIGEGAEICAGAWIGEGAVIGGNTWVIESVRPGERVLNTKTSQAKQEKIMDRICGFGDGI